jgi:Fe-S-cluster containining protein
MEEFTCQRCGNCCRVPGYVRLAGEEIPRIASHLGLEVREFTRQYTRLTRDRSGLSLKEHPDHSCIFLGGDGACGIQGAKPRQCRSFPVYWRFEGFERICRACDVSNSPSERRPKW